MLSVDCCQEEAAHLFRLGARLAEHHDTQELQILWHLPVECFETYLLRYGRLRVTLDNPSTGVVSNGRQALSLAS